MEDGSIPVPTEPGLGIELDREALEEFAEAAKRLVR
jgi:L-alanine-DL-glutamate epimerase-like enolase superfamily enzyme